MCQASLTVTLKNASQISAICVCVCVFLTFCVCVYGYESGICADTAILLNTVVTVEALGYKSLIRSGNVRIIQREIAIRQRNQQLKYCYSDHICSYTECSPDYEEQCFLLLHELLLSLF